MESSVSRRCFARVLKTLTRLAGHRALVFVAPVIGRQSQFQ